MSNEKDEHICVQTGIACGFPCWHECPLWEAKCGKHVHIDISPDAPRARDTAETHNLT